MHTTPVAIIGMRCRFPGASDPRALWHLITSGHDTVGEMPVGRWDRQRLQQGIDDGAAGRVAGFTGGFLDDDAVRGFDWRSFRMLPREVRGLDPQQRLMLELAWEALEDAGMPLEEARERRAGVFVGIQWNDYFRLLCRDWTKLDGYSVLGNPLMFAANRISYSLGLTGPSVSMDCGCSSGLAALRSACQSLWLGEADMAIAGAVELMLSPDTAIAMQATGMLSRAGLCRALDAEADGFVRSEGAGVVVLKRLEDVRPDERVYAVVRGVSLVHNGHNEWIMAASGEAQKRAVREACAMAGVAPSGLDYVELHGTGSPKGDPLEVRALADVVGQGREGREPCLIGSVKSNLGHLGAASGMASLIKVALSLHHQEIPPTVRPTRLHPDIAAIGLEDAGLAVADELRAWPRQDQPALAGVTNLSLGGVNAHAVLASAPAPGPRPEPGTTPAAESRDLLHLLPLSARSQASLSALARDYAAALEDENLLLDDLCYTAQRGRSHHEHRLAVTGRSAAELASALRRAADQSELPESAGDGSSGDDQTAQSGDRDAALRALAREYTAGATIDWRAAGCSVGRIISLPTYAWQREVMWPKWLHPAQMSTPPEPVPAIGALGRPLRLARPAGAQLWQTEVEAVSEDSLDGLVSEMAARGLDWTEVEFLRVETPGTLPAPDRGRQGLQLFLVPAGPGRAEAEIFARPAARPAGDGPDEPDRWTLLWRVEVRRPGAELPAESDAGSRSERDRFLEAFRAADDTQARILVAELVRAELARVLDPETTEKTGTIKAFDADRPLIELGLDSFSASELANHLAARTGVTVPTAQIFSEPTVAGIAGFLQGELTMSSLVQAVSGGGDGDPDEHDDSVEVLRL